MKGLVNMENQVSNKVKPTPSQRLINAVTREFGEVLPDGQLNLSDYHRRLVQGYFIMIDRALTIAEEARIKKNSNNTNHHYDNLIPYDWDHVNMRDLALDAVHSARMGLDMQEKNHLFPIPYANKKTGKYDISFTVGYNGVRYIAEKYAADPPIAVTIELVYSTDKFVPYKKSRSNSVESYDFEITNPFDRGEVSGGFGYIEYSNPSKNKLIIMNVSDIKKRAGKNASAEFWGTATTGKQILVWENGQKTYADTDGWFEEMCRKTIIREVFSSKHIPRDPSKIDDDYQHLKEREFVYAQAEIDNEADENANTVPIDIPAAPAALPQPTPKAEIINNNQSADVENVPLDSADDTAEYADQLLEFELDDPDF